MNQFLQKHKNKIAILLPSLVLFFLICGAFYFASKTGNISVISINNFQDTIAAKQFSNLNIQAKAYVVYDSNQRRIIYAKNPVSQLPLASLTKIMSSLVALDIADKSTIITVPANNPFYNTNDKTSISPGRWRLDDLLRLTLVSSSNEGINTVANQLSTRGNFLGGEKHFIELMNQKAKMFGLDQTFFINESGLDVNSSLAGSYGSAIDVARLFDFAINTYPNIFTATKYGSIVINSTDGNSETAFNTNSAVSNINGLIASKTGFTELAQGNLAIAFDLDPKKRIVIVVLGSTQDARFTDIETLSRATLAYYSLI